MKSLKIKLPHWLLHLVRLVHLPLLKNEVDVERMRMFGEKVGIAFQIKDDLFDYGNTDIGKPTGNDIKEKKLTLPLIYTLNNVDRALKKELIYIIKNKNTDKEKVEFVIKEVEKAGGIKYTEKKCLNIEMKL